MADALLNVRDLTVEFELEGRRARAVNEVSFALDQGEMLAVVGESGCGKSVTALAVLGLLARPPAHVSGEILFEGRDLALLPERELRKLRGSRISMIFQDPLASLNPVLTVGDQVAETVRIHTRATAKDAWRRTVEMLDRVGLPDPARRAHSYPHELSGGQRQRVMVAMAFICHPRLVIADEPTTALDVTVQRQVLDLMLELRKDQGAAVILITHDLGVVAEVADRVQVMYAGRLVEQGSVREIFYEPRHPYTQALLASVPRLQGERQDRLKGIPGQPPDLANPVSGCPFRPRCPAAFEPCDVMPGWEDYAPLHRGRCWADGRPLPEREAGGQAVGARSG